ncbi:ThiF family adenylyltransferase [Brachybacterium sp. UMB0905]|uniref:ThiF family adenylyltransferase n=1 Tax=Brachybacterium sp. UMB0905 TaxID=2069310 RepID=UPI001E2CC7EA|nr:ThiF family adenylyltransferase [Brachybacterium sp. UMB0905]
MTTIDPDLSPRHARQLRLPGFGPAEQRRLRDARVLVVGAGGLGAPVLSYLTGVGVGHLTVLDADRVDESNLHRQVIHATAEIGEPKAESAARRMRALDPAVHVTPLTQTLTVDNALDIIAGHDLVLDGTDNFPTRYLVSDACEILDVPLVWGSILAYAGQVSVFDAAGGSGVTYRDVHPVPPRPGEVPSCAEAGVLGMLCGVIGSTMALEAVKVLTGVGEDLRGRIALFDALTMTWAQLPVRRDPSRAPVTELEDLTLTCGLPGADAGDAREISAREALKRQRDGALLVDVREAEEVAGGMVAGARHLPLGEITEDPAAQQELAGAILYCAAGKRSAAAQKMLAGVGIEVLSVADGYPALVAAGAD